MITHNNSLSESKSDATILKNEIVEIYINHISKSFDTDFHSKNSSPINSDIFKNIDKVINKELQIKINESQPINEQEFIFNYKEDIKKYNNLEKINNFYIMFNDFQTLKIDFMEKFTIQKKIFNKIIISSKVIKLHQFAISNSVGNSLIKFMDRTWRKKRSNCLFKKIE